MNAAERPQTSRQSAPTGQWISLYSQGPDSLFTPPRSLCTQLVIGVFGLILIVTAAINTFSTAGLCRTFMTRMDSRSMVTTQRAADKRYDLTQKVRKTSNETIQGDAKNQGDRPDGTAGTGGDPDKPKAPPGLDATRQSTGTLTLITLRVSSSGSETSEIATYIDKSGHCASISRKDCRLLLSQATKDHPVTVDLYHLDNYRVMTTRDKTSGNTAITGFSLGGDEELICTQLLIELAIAPVNALMVALAGRIVICFALAPLEQMVRTAYRAVSQSLEYSEVSIEDHMEGTDLGSSAEVGQIDGALNTLLGYAESALVTRQRSETQVCQFVIDVSHELCTPLASTRGYIKFIRREGADADLPEETTCALGRVHPESVRMTALVEDLLLLARLDAGRELRRERVDLVSLLVDTVVDARVAGSDHDWQLDLAVLEPPAGATPEEAEDFPPEPPLIIGDETHLHQVIVNPLANIRVHTPAGSRVATMLARKGGTLIMRIHDDGPGIAPDMRDRLSECSARGDFSRERRIGSTDLDMSIAPTIVQSHGGNTDVTSSTMSESHGTTLSIRLPTATVEE